MELRTADEDEIDEISALLLAAYAEFEPPADAPERPSWDEYYNEEIPDVRGRWAYGKPIVAVEDGRIIATATYISDASDDRMLDDRWPPGYAAMRLLGVHPDARNRRLGRLLTEECIRRARAEGREWFGLHTTHLMAVARDMYERMGFERFPDNDIPITDTFTVTAYRLKLP